ncbi:uncharacterized protein OCT59_009921 [Rhizophagus irregularis]|uniref:Uncharacterized protein n=2 Tax=Rhizophagus irregularis TaxID=588596 RepID=A0A015IW26_RHIIW|nr:hypothetical protein RirG_197410 [Rhizophagus irregularis DAOM 197198w]UZO18609.1 hypothetical protein OCT59_009921 [Rhizophagus irregularis]GBC29323.1 hypothetical protein GLOIN_2v1678377 [Rhizophagus irregularis DAOM 181602=DAOM 197198]
MKFIKLNPFNVSKKKAIEIENESLKNEIKSLNRSFNDCKNELLTFKEGFENGKITVNKLQNDKQDDEKKYMELKQKYDSFDQKYKDQNDNFEELIRQRDEQIVALKQKCDDFEELKQKHEKYKEQIGDLENLKQKSEQQLKEKTSQIKSLKQKNNELEEAASKYQSASEELKRKYDDQNDSFDQKYKDQNDKFEELIRQRDEQIVALKQKCDDFEELKQKHEKYKEQIGDLENLKQKSEQQLKEKTSQIKSLKQKNKELEEAASTYQSASEELKRKYDDQSDSFDQKYKDQNDKFEESKRKCDVALKQKCNDFEELNQKYKEQIGDLEDLKKQKEYFDSQYKKSEQQLKEKTTQIKSLKQKNKELEEEASKYQSALGIATSFDFNIDDQNNNVKLNQDILSLQDTLEIYVTNLKPKIDVNINEVNELLLTYECQSKISEKDPNKPLIKAVLQRRVLEEILAQADFYFKEFKDSNKDHHLESNIVSKTVVLNNLMEKLYNSRLGDDEITRITPIRIRQQVYTALGTRGFNDIRKTDGEILKHDSIDIISNKINKVINKYRIINDIDKRRYVNALAKDLVLNVVRIFYFRLPIQEPMAQYHWFNNNERINKSYMKGCWDEDEIEDMVVEVCSFPMIYKPEDDGDKICTPAKVFPIHIIKEQSIGEKLMSMVKYIYSSNDDSNATKFDESDEYDSDQTNVTEPDESSYHFHDKINDQVIVY